MQKILVLCLVVVFIFLQVQIRYGHGSKNDNQKLKAEIAKQTNLNQQLEDRNHDMVVHIEDLNGSPASLEARARYELNLIKPNETLVLLPGSDLKIKK